MAAARVDDELKLLGFWGSPFVLRARLALGFIKGLRSYEYVEEDLANKSDLLLRSNPAHGGKVPVLLHNGRPVCETLVILQYLDEVYGGPSSRRLLPVDDPYRRATARFWAAYIDDKLLSSLMMASSRGEEEAAEGRRRAVAAVETLEGALEECSGGGGGKRKPLPFFGGDSVGFVDVVLGGFVPWLRLIDRLAATTGAGSPPPLVVVDAGRTPLLAAWMERFASLDEAKAVMPDVERLQVELSKRGQPQPY